MKLVAAAFFVLLQSLFPCEGQVAAEWQETGKLTSSDGAAYADFGNAIAIDEDTMVVGAPRDSNGFRLSEGSVFVYVRDGRGSWTEQAKLWASDLAPYDNFGSAVDVYGDTLVVGAFGDDDKGKSSGSVYVFVRDAEGTWAESGKLMAGDGAAHDWSGYAVAIHDNTVVVGATNSVSDKGTGSGAAYVFLRDEGGNWLEQFN